MLGTTSHEELEVRIRRILRAGWATDLSLGACRAWAKQFMTTHVRGWYPGMVLSTDDAQRVGRIFEDLCTRSYGYEAPKMKKHVRNENSKQSDSDELDGDE